MNRAIQVRPWQFIKVNQQDLVDKFSRKIGHLGRKLVHKSMVQAYNQALTDVCYLLLAAEKDTSEVEIGPEASEVEK